jgi:hypothetical protein
LVADSGEDGLGFDGIGLRFLRRRPDRRNISSHQFPRSVRVRRVTSNSKHQGG